MAHRFTLNRRSLGAYLARKLIYSNTKYSIGKYTITISLVITCLLVTLLIIYELLLDEGFGEPRIYIGIAGILYLCTVRYLFLINKTILSYWLLIAFFGCIATQTLLTWGINTVSGVLALGYIIALSGVLIGAKRIPVVLGIAGLVLTAVQSIHQSGIITPKSHHITEPSSYGDVITYMLIFSTLAVTLWLSMRRSEYALHRARQAEKKLRTQRELLKIRLAQESAKLRANQLKEVQQLYAFAALGQNTAATLHELSNHLTVLGMDIESLRGATKLSRALIETQESFERTTAIVKTVRRQLDSYNSNTSILPYVILKDAIRDIKDAFSKRTTRLELDIEAPESKKVRIKGDPLALTHIVSILLKNALEACADFPEAKVYIRLAKTKALVRITVSDNGIGIAQEVLPSLFSPITSTKPTGLGAGLFIAHHLAKTQLSGTLRLASNCTEDIKRGYLKGATFALEIPIEKGTDNEKQ